MTRDERLARLTSSRDNIFARREAQRRERERAETAECTFRPATIAKPSGPGAGRPAGVAGAPTSTASGDGGMTLQNRLHHESDLRAAAREQARREREAQELGSFPFKPSICPRTDDLLDMSQRRPIYEVSVRFVELAFPCAGPFC